LEPFRIFSKIRGDIRELMFITGVKNTGNKLFSRVNDTSEKFIAGVVEKCFQWSGSMRKCIKTHF
jgi:predicted ATPase